MKILGGTFATSGVRTGNAFQIGPIASQQTGRGLDLFERATFLRRVIGLSSRPRLRVGFFVRREERDRGQGDRRRGSVETPAGRMLDPQKSTGLAFQPDKDCPELILSLSS